jgi:hypothetical protein
MKVPTSYVAPPEVPAAVKDDTEDAEFLVSIETRKDNVITYMKPIIAMTLTKAIQNSASP